MKIASGVRILKGRLCKYLCDELRLIYAGGLLIAFAISHLGFLTEVDYVIVGITIGT